MHFFNIAEEKLSMQTKLLIWTHSVAYCSCESVIKYNNASFDETLTD